MDEMTAECIRRWEFGSQCALDLSRTADNGADRISTIIEIAKRMVLALPDEEYAEDMYIVETGVSVDEIMSHLWSARVGLYAIAGAYRFAADRMDHSVANAEAQAKAEDDGS